MFCFHEGRTEMLVLGKGRFIFSHSCASSCQSKYNYYSALSLIDMWRFPESQVMLSQHNSELVTATWWLSVGKKVVKKVLLGTVSCGKFASKAQQLPLPVFAFSRKDPARWQALEHTENKAIGNQSMVSYLYCYYYTVHQFPFCSIVMKSSLENMKMNHPLFRQPSGLCVIYFFKIDLK